MKNIILVIYPRRALRFKQEDNKMEYFNGVKYIPAIFNSIEEIKAYYHDAVVKIEGI